MKIKYLAYVLAASTVLPLQAVLIQNRTSESINFSNFISREDGQPETMWRTFITIDSGEDHDVDTAIILDNNIDEFAAYINESPETFTGMKGVSKITFVEVGSMIVGNKS